jgi:hypothetical protein
MSDERGSDPTALPRPEPPVNPETEPYWAAAAEGRLLLGECVDCGLVFHYPRARCPDCLGETEWVESEGTGEIYAHTVTRQTGGEYADATPFVLAYVELDEGPRVMTNVVTDDPGGLAVGQPVEVVFHEAGDYAIPRFEPV